MIPLSADLLTQIHTVLEQCHCFDTAASLRAVFEPSLELSHWSSGLPEVSDRGERIYQTVAYLLKHASRDGHLAFTIFLTVLRQTHYTFEDPLYDELDQLRAEVERETGKITFIPVPFAVCAMTRDEAGPLFTTPAPNVTDPALFRDLLAALGPAGIQAALDGYTAERDAWRPLTSPGQTISQLVEEAVEFVNQSERRPVRLQPEFVSGRFLAADPAVRRPAQEQFSAAGGVMLVDSLSLFHPQLHSRLLQAEISSNENIALLVISPIDPGVLTVNRLIETHIGDQMERLMERFERKNDYRCEVGRGDMRGIRRWLAAILPHEIERIQNPRPHPDNRNLFPAPRRGISGLIGGGGAAR